MKDGAVGLSTGLIYVPGTYAKTDEIVALARVAARYGGLYATHMRNEGDKVADAIRESIQIGEQAGLPVEISHFKISNKKLWGQSPMTLGLVREARARGLSVTVDQYATPRVRRRSILVCRVVARRWFRRSKEATRRQSHARARRSTTRKTR
jgi:N-acyl-D-amino-acid deacylase